MSLESIRPEDEKYALEFLEKLYQNKTIVSEKKPYLSNLRESIGPYLAIETETGSPHYLLDAASQIATLGLGFSPLALFGTTHFYESWSNNETTLLFKEIHKSFESFLKRKAQNLNYNLILAHSGAEANETALGLCFKNKKSKNEKKVLAFEGSFHGRMMVTLSATWNKSKREPFEWPDYDVDYCPYPEDLSGKIRHQYPSNWLLTWENSPLKKFEIPSSWNQDSLLRNEIEILLMVRDKLMSGTIYAILTEPMQCEGGDRYSSDRFNNALILLAKAFTVPLVYDEVQTGFHLGNSFFWHQQFNLTDSQNNNLYPDYIVCAKKAQLGLVLSLKDDKHNLDYEEEFNVASLIRGQLHAIALDQSRQTIQWLEEIASQKLLSLVSEFNTELEHPRGQGLAFSFDFIHPEKIQSFIQNRFNQGLLFYPAGSKTLRFRLNTSYKEEDILELFTRLKILCLHIFQSQKLPKSLPFETKWSSPQKLFGLHSLVVSNQIKTLKGIPIDSNDIWIQVKALFAHNFQAEIIELTSANFPKYKNEIEKIQKEIYEPTRQTDIKNFEKVANSSQGISLVVLKNNKILAHAFSSPIMEHPFERGTRRDPNFFDNQTHYILDTTVSKNGRGLGLGTFLKSALYLKALSQNVNRIQGRNRDQLASTMMLINLSLGAYTQDYIKEDYLDERPHRDVFYYSQKIKWDLPQPNFSNGLKSPLGIKSIDDSFINKSMPFLINKVCLSNFVSRIFLEGITQLAHLLDKDFQHLYTTSGQSECVDKIAKTIWFHQKGPRKSHKLLTFKNHFFGHGSFLSRELSHNTENYFPKKVLNHPTTANQKGLLVEIEGLLKKDSFLGVWIEPVVQKTFERVPIEFLQNLKKLCGQYKTPLIYNETASSRFHFSQEHFFCSNDPLISPDLGMTYLGGQMGLVFSRSEYFLEKPLMLISTWDGDEYSLLAYLNEVNAIEKDIPLYLKTRENFTQKLKSWILEFQVKNFNLQNGVGSFYGALPPEVQTFFHKGQDGRYLVCSSYDIMKSFIEHK